MLDCVKYFFQRTDSLAFEKLVPMKKLFPFLSSIAFLVFLGILVVLKIRHYDYNLSSLIGIWQGFSALNPDYIPKGFVLFEEGGYDGQFFFFLSRFLFEWNNLPFPILDSFYFRFHRLGLSLVAGAPLAWIGHGFYPIFTLFLLTITHIISFIMLYNFLPFRKKKLALFYLFNPYSILGILLLVSDPFLIALGLVSSLLIWQVPFFSFRQLGTLILGMVLFSVSLLVRETSIFLIAPLLLFSIGRRQYFKLVFLLPPVVLYLTFLIFTQNWSVPHEGTSPLKFLDMVDYPLFGFFKSWESMEGFSLKQLAREGVKFLLFSLYIQLILNLGNIRREWKLSGKKSNLSDTGRTLALFTLLIPVIATLGVITIAEQGYWRSFDNLARMFTIVTPVIIIAKAKWEGYRDYGFLYLSLALTLFLLLRVSVITKPMQFFLAE